MHNQPPVNQVPANQVPANQAPANQVPANQANVVMQPPAQVPPQAPAQPQPAANQPLPNQGLDGIYQDILAYGIANPNHHEDSVSIAGFFAAQCTKKCGFCNQWGHQLKKCPLKTTMDQQAANIPTWRIVWGSIKSAAKNRRVQNGINQASAALALQAQGNPINAIGA